MEIKYPNLIKVHHSHRGIQKHTIAMLLIIIVLSTLLCFSAKADIRIIYSPNLETDVIEIDGDYGVVEYDTEKGVSFHYVDNPYQTISITDEEFNELRWVLALEAQGEGFQGEVACCEAILNRCLSQKNNWGGNIHGVLSKKKQFSSYKYIGSSKAWAVPGEMEDDVISEVLRRGLTILPSYSYVYFDSKGGVNGKHKIKLGHHTFGEE